MVDPALQNAWEKACEMIQPEISNVSYSTWIQPLKIRARSGARLILEAKDLFSKNTILQRYSTLLSTALLETYGQMLDISVVTPDEKVAETTPAGEGTPLNPRYTFDTFVVGNSNRFAHAASLAVAEAPSDAYNPLFLYGGVGLGKTHLMHAIGHFMMKENPNLKVLYTTSEKFTNELIAAISNKTNQQMRDRFRGVDVLLVDDIQFIAGRNATQEEFFHTFNELHEAGKQVIISSDKPPKEIPTLEERLRSRFEWGLIADIQKPDYETRIAILAKKAENENIQIDMDVLAFIADKVDSNIRELEGSLTRVNAFASLSGREITLSMADEALRSILSARETRNITPQDIMNVVSRFYGVQVEKMTSQRRNREILLPRQVAMYLMRDMLGTTFPMIGQHFGGRDHTTVMSACEKIQDALATDPQLKGSVEDLRELIRAS